MAEIPESLEVINSTERRQQSHLPLDDEVGVIQALDDGHLMLQGQFRILLNHVGQSF